MKALFKYLQTQIATVPAINWIDLDKGQISRYDTRPAIDFPAALIKINYPGTSKLSRTEQQCQAQIIVTLAFDEMGETSNITNETELNESLEVYETADNVHRVLQGHIDNSIMRAPLERVSMQDPNRPDALKTIVLTYTTRVID